MGKIVQAIKITHVPSIWMSHTIEKFKGIRQPAIDGYAKIRQQSIDVAVDTFIIFDTHWIVNQGFHLNANAHHQGTFTSHELPHMLSNMEYDHEGDHDLAHLIADEMVQAGHKGMAHDQKYLGLEYGTLIPMHFINQGKLARVLPVAVNQYSSIEENRLFGEILARAVEKSDRKVALLASGSLSHNFWPNSKSEAGINLVNGEFNQQMDKKVVAMWKNGEWKDFLGLLPDYAAKCHGEVGMNDTALLFGALGWDQYHGTTEEFTPYFGSSGTGQISVGFSV